MPGHFVADPGAARGRRICAQAGERDHGTGAACAGPGCGGRRRECQRHAAAGQKVAGGCRSGAGRRDDGAGSGDAGGG